MINPNRRGAPVTSFVRFDKKPILERGYIFHPDAVVVLDETLNFSVMTKGLSKNGFILINSHKNKNDFKKFGIKQKIYLIDATQIALEILNKPIANSGILGALTKILKLNFKKLEEAIKTELTEVGHGKAVEKNILIVKKCFKMIK
jgi:pyruvate ferredoxin oxidoreductase gamma subunit